MYRTILVPLDGSRFSEHALSWALALARRYDASLRLATVADLEPPEREDGGEERRPTADGRERGMAAAETYLQAVKERIGAAGFTGSVETSVLSPGNVTASLVEERRKVDADLTVMTTHGRGPVQRAWLGSVADGFLRRTARPLLLVRPEEVQEGDDGPLPLDPLPPFPGKVLLPLDGSPAGERLLEWAPGVADPEATFFLVRAVSPMLPGGSPYLPHLVREQEEHERVVDAAREYLERAATRLPGGRAEVRVPAAGQPAEAILDLAEEEGVHLIAMSTSGRGGVARLLVGSVADKVIRGAPCPILLYRDPEG